MFLCEDLTPNRVRCSATVTGGARTGEASFAIDTATCRRGFEDASPAFDGFIRLRPTVDSAGEVVRACYCKYSIRFAAKDVDGATGVQLLSDGCRLNMDEEVWVPTHRIETACREMAEKRRRAGGERRAPVWTAR